MNKILRLTFVALLAMVSNVINAETKFDFANDALTMFGFTSASSSTSSDGDFNEAKSYTLDGITITVSPADEGQENANRVWGTAGKYTLRMYSGTLKVSSKTALKNISFEVSKINVTPSTGTYANKVWTAKGDEKEVTFTIGGNTQISAMTVGGSGEATQVTWNNKSFADLVSATANISNVNLTLKDAKVVYVQEVTAGTKYNYAIRQDGQALMLYGSALQLPLNATISGELKCDYAYYYGIPELKDISGSTSTDGLTITKSSSTEYDATPATVADILALKHVADLVSLSNVTINSDGNIVDGDNVLTNYKGIDLKDYADGKMHTVIAWFNAIYKNKCEVAAVSIDGTSTGIQNTSVVSTFKSVRYNLAGQKVGKDYKGLVIENGKKIMVK